VQALQGNTQVSEIQISLRGLMPAFFDTRQLGNIIAPLIRYIQTSESIRSVSLRFEHTDRSVNERLKAALLNAVFEKGKHIKELLCYCIVPGFVFNAGMRSAPSMLQKLDVVFGPSSIRERVAIASVFGSSSSLEELRLVTDDADLSADILIALTDATTNHSLPLRELVLKCRGNANLAYWSALAGLAHRAEHLKHLMLDTEQFDETAMDTFLNCLNSPSAISKLTFEMCSFDLHAMRSFQRFMELRKEADTLHVSSLTDLAFGVTATMEGWSGSLFASVFCLKQEAGQKGMDDINNWYTTIGSCLTSLSVGLSMKGCAGFLKIWANNPQMVRLTSLSFSRLNKRNCMHLARYLANVSSLLKLEIDEFHDDNLVREGLRRNGTLLSVSLYGGIASRLANNYCLRNKLLRALLQKLACVESDESMGDTDRSVTERRAESLYPTLLHVAKQISAFRVSTAVSSLLNLAESVGPIK
jgi:hypothetical protein